MKNCTVLLAEDSGWEDRVFRFARLFYTRQNLKLKMTQDVPF